MTAHDRSIVRDLAARVRDVAALPVQQQKRDLWKAHNGLKPHRPMILIFPEGAWSELLPSTALECSDPAARAVEGELRRRLYCHAHFADDTVVEAGWPVRKVVTSSGWGLEPQRHAAPTERGAWSFEPVFNSVDDLQKLQVPTITHDAAASERNLAQAEELLGDILPVRSVGVAHISYHLMQQYTSLRGLEQMMIDMYDAPDLIHRAMQFFVAGHQAVLKQYQALNLLTLNNDETYHSSGGVGYTDEIPLPDYDPERIAPCDMWASAESQELAQVGPSQHQEFALHYEAQLLEPFALTGYGCCEPLTDRLGYVFALPGIRRISISPWAQVDVAAAELGPNYIFSWKPRPMDLVGSFDEDTIRSYIRSTLDHAKRRHCAIELVLKDTHTCEHRPERFDRWSQIARAEVERVASGGW